MSLEVVEVNGLASIQDSGRTGWRRYGVPTSGAMDMFAFQSANRLAGNPVDAAAIEIGFGDMRVRALRDSVLAVTGVGYVVSVYAWEFPLWTSFFVRRGWEICLRKVDAGTWAYLAVHGGVQVQPVLDSRSTNLRGHFGGLGGRALQAGDILRTGTHVHSFHEFEPRTLSSISQPRYGTHPILDVIMGPQTKNFTAASIERFFSSEYRMTSSSDRMGYRLEGPALTLRSANELISEGMTTGSIQVPASGQPIVMMADSPTTGGYSKIGSVISADLPLLAQCVPNESRIRFKKISVTKAQKKYRDMMNGIDKGITQLEENDAWY